jgi:hypothetical protein
MEKCCRSPFVATLNTCNPLVEMFDGVTDNRVFHLRDGEIWLGPNRVLQLRNETRRLE